MKKEYLGHPKCHVGPGGMNCPCCSPMRVHPRKSKPLMRRIVRRRNKHNINKMMED